MPQKLVLIGNGFDLAHGLKTSYRDFIDWYMCNCFKDFCLRGSFDDRLFSIQRKWQHMTTQYPKPPINAAEVIEFVSYNDRQTYKYKSNFYQRLLELLSKGWVDIEFQYFQRLKRTFLNVNLNPDDKTKAIKLLNEDFDHIISLLTEYITFINSAIKDCKKLPIKMPDVKYNLFGSHPEPLTFINFNYTDTLSQLEYSDEKDIIHIHGRASDVCHNPIIFGYGDQTDPVYQQIEDSGDNIYLEHIKSFAYFKTENYRKLIRIIDSDVFDVFVFGHSCGMSDRILLNEIFEHDNCRSIEVFYHERRDGSNNFKEITQEMSRHFKPQNKGQMLRKVSPQSSKNIIPQQQV